MHLSTTTSLHSHTTSTHTHIQHDTTRSTVYTLFCLSSSDVPRCKPHYYYYYWFHYVITFFSSPDVPWSALTGGIGKDVFAVAVARRR